MRTYMVKIRLKGSVSWVEVQARDAGQAKALVRAQYGDSIDILEAKNKVKDHLNYLDIQSFDAIMKAALI